MCVCLGGGGSYPGSGVTPPLSPQVWLELAETLGEGLEEVTAAAFSQVRGGRGGAGCVGGNQGQCVPVPDPPRARRTPLRCPLQVLTVAATEPLNLLHSVPPPRPPALPEEGRGDTAGTPPRTPPPPAPPSGDFAVDFARLYEFLARLCRGGGAPPLPPAGEGGVGPLVTEGGQEEGLGSAVGGGRGGAGAPLLLGRVGSAIEGGLGTWGGGGGVGHPLSLGEGSGGVVCLMAGGCPALGEGCPPR